MNLEEFTKKTILKEEYGIRPRIICNDGFKMSVQGGTGMYSNPREMTDFYLSMEIGFPSQKEELIMEYAEEADRPTETVYGWVDCKIIQQVIDKHKGIDVKKTFKR